MKIKNLLLIMLIALPLLTIAKPTTIDTNSKQSSSQERPVAKTTPRHLEDTQYLGYSMDGVTSASKLAAQRSHTVAGKDERNFAVFTGIVVVLIVIFFSQIVFNKS